MIVEFAKQQHFSDHCRGMATLSGPARRGFLGPVRKETVGLKKDEDDVYVADKVKISKNKVSYLYRNMVLAFPDDGFGFLGSVEKDLEDAESLEGVNAILGKFNKFVMIGGEYKEAYTTLCELWQEALTISDSYHDIGAKTED